MVDLNKKDLLVDKICEMTVNISFQPSDVKHKLECDSKFRKQFVIDNAIQEADRSY